MLTGQLTSASGDTQPFTLGTDTGLLGPSVHALLVLGGIWMAPWFICPKEAINFFPKNKKQRVQNTLEFFQTRVPPDTLVDILSGAAATRGIRLICCPRIPFRLRPGLGSKQSVVWGPSYPSQLVRGPRPAPGTTRDSCVRELSAHLLAEKQTLHAPHGGNRVHSRAWMTQHWRALTRGPRPRHC